MKAIIFGSGAVLMMLLSLFYAFMYEYSHAAYLLLLAAWSERIADGDKKGNK
jgi:hypothetical protein